MPSRQDQLQSHQFMVQRVVSALVMRETDPAQPPFRRAAGATLAGVLVAAIALGGFVVYGALADGGGTAWRDTSAVIVERESGARYVYREGKLHLVVNYASALLAVGSPQPKTVLVSRRSIEGVPRGSTLGIAEAPDSLPAAGRLLGPPWTVCALPGPASAVLVGATGAGGVRLGDRGVLARHSDGSLHLVWQGHRYRVRDPGLALTALGWTTAPVLVAPALLDALPAGADLAVPRISGAGEPSTAVPSALIGEVFVVTSQGGGRQYALAVRDGLAGITQVQADLLLTAGRQDQPTDLSQGRFAATAKAPDLVPDGLVPTVTPSLVESVGRALCAEVRDERGVADVVVDADLPDLADAVSSRPGDGVDHVVVAPGRAALVETVALGNRTGGTVSIVTDLGRRHAVVGAETLAMLGYGGVRPLRLPSAVVALIEESASLDPARAREPV
ncbi:type VII secretion protein EccB [Asanoa ishikariensis]|uniref:Type VII secretion protein EccB n=1 Tax=Asanoa ishikariensis TaxID=137265 RepID=A0A1H3LE61_9ACTN|nr:type VII secretion protein EccB [Asanoa ishikariensis]GIF65423.1 type VII secretion protein EccB [Asanoa ishikariensis]SDY62722.1 type VII secretion protein EccB [Asanoa ishikariensis]